MQWPADLGESALGVSEGVRLRFLVQDWSESPGPTGPTGLKVKSSKAPCTAPPCKSLCSHGRGAVVGGDDGVEGAEGTLLRRYELETMLKGSSVQVSRSIPSSKAS